MRCNTQLSRVMIRLLAVLLCLAGDMLALAPLTPAMAQVDDRYIGVIFSRRTQPARRNTGDGQRRRTEAEATRPRRTVGNMSSRPAFIRS